VHLGSGGASDEQRDGHLSALHLLGHEDHLVERGSDEPGEAEDLRAVLGARGEDAVGVLHHAAVNHLKGKT